MAHQHLLWPESVPVRAARRRLGDPLPGRGLHQLAQHDFEVIRSVCQTGGIRICQLTGVPSVVVGSTGGCADPNLGPSRLDGMF
jgi:hypothetical protein